MLHKNNTIIVSNVSSNLRHLYLLDEQQPTLNFASNVLLEHYLLVLVANILSNVHNQYGIPIEQQQILLRLT